MESHQLTRHHPNTESRRVGRGGKRGKTSGRGGKGQTARAGSRMRPEMRDTIKRLPKRRGYGRNRADTVNNARRRALPVNLALLEEIVTSGDTVSPTFLIGKGVINFRGKKMPMVKLLGVGTLSKKITVTGCIVSDSAKAAIEKAGGSVL
jgi:large subunit ribosomal protein L15